MITLLITLIAPYWTHFWASAFFLSGYWVVWLQHKLEHTELQLRLCRELISLEMKDKRNEGQDP